MVRLLAFLMAVFFSNQAAAQTLIGEGGNTCRSWTQLRQVAGSIEAANEQAWILGFLSGIDLLVVADKVGPDILKDVNEDELVDWISKYCLSNPQDELMIAAVKLIGDLKSRKLP